jgi:ubiquinone/menaquinone biosynthesis C-methylase UbiE
LLEIFSQKKIDYLGLDISQNLIDVARRKYPDHSSDFQKISGYGSLALEDEFFNAVYSVAVFHHIPGKKQRRELAEEIFRVTKKGGYVVITVWNLWQDKYRENIFKNWAKKVVGRSDLGWNDCRISFTDNKGNVFKRYHHAWTVKEMVKIFGAAGFSIEKCEVVGGNILLIGKRPE